MLHIILSRLVWCVVLMILQVFLFNHVHLWGYATPLCYVYFLLILPADTPLYEFPPCAGQFPHEKPTDAPLALATHVSEHVSDSYAHHGHLRERV